MYTLFEQYPALETLMQNVSEVAGLLWEREWAERNAGNISLNITEIIIGEVRDDMFHDQLFELTTSFPELSEHYFIITCTGSRMRQLAVAPWDHAVIIKLTVGGDAFKIISEGDTKSHIQQPTSELITHLAIHQLVAQRGSKEKIVLHTHPTELIALTQNPEFKSTESINALLWGMHPETIVFLPMGVGFVPYALPGSTEIAKQTIESLRKHDLVLWEKHGVFAIANSVEEAFDTIDIVCKSAKIYFLCKSAGFVPEGLSTPQLSELKGLASKFHAS
jgi:rhamnulose-1-phosphate aldolase